MDPRLLCVLAACMAPALSASWDYNITGPYGPSHWKDSHPLCDDNSQSPIDIVTDTAEYDDDLTSFTFTGYNPLPAGLTFTLENNGHTAKLSLGGSTLPTLSGGDLPGTFRLVQMHGHWGEDSSTGSEHTLNGDSFPAEFHFVHLNEKYADFYASQGNSDGLAVLGIMFEEGSTDNAAWGQLLDELTNIPYSGDTISLATFQLQALLPPELDNYYRYSGSLTTPTCDEIVTWTVFPDPVYVSAAQLNKLRMIYTNTNGTAEDVAMVDNYRPVQNLNSRTVYTSISTGGATTATSGTGLMAAMLAVALWLHRN